jgi:hypothetical protein
VIPGRKVDEAIDAAPHAESSPAREVVQEELRRVASLSGLLRREKALLGRRDFVEMVPVGALRLGGGHARNVSVALVLCKAAGMRQSTWSPSLMGVAARLSEEQRSEAVAQ